MNLNNITMKMVLNNEYNIKPFFNLEQAQKISDMEKGSCIYQIKPESTDSPEVLQNNKAYLVVVQKSGRFYAHDNVGGFVISEDTVLDSLIN
tara:strand:- start:36176 stop:36451 length:276 start_codon:yes stop_codon:yes gene_type:complete